VPARVLGARLPVALAAAEPRTAVLAGAALAGAALAAADEFAR